MKNKDKIIDAFCKVKELGWIKSHRKNNTGIGKTFEDCIGVEENNHKNPDLFGYEIKAHREKSTSYITLFTKSPSGPITGANAYLKDKFGESYPNSNLKKLHTSIFANDYNTFMGKYSFKLIHKPEEEKIYIGVFTLDGVELDASVYYTYDDIKDTLLNKLFRLFYVSAKSRKNSDKTESFYYDSAEIFTEPTLKNFLDMLDNGEIMYDIRIGAYKSGKYYGKPHDHGSGFRIISNKLGKLYSQQEKVE